MGTMSLRLPRSLHRRLRELAEEEGVSMNQLINAAVAEKLSALMTVEYLEERAARADREKFEAVLAKVPDAEPRSGDELPEASEDR